MKKICIIGCFNFFKFDNGGQPVKSRELYFALKEKIGIDNISYVESSNWKKSPFKFFFDIVRSAYKNDICIILPAQNGVKILIPLFYVLKCITKTKVVYNVIGAWIPQMIENSKILRLTIKKIDYIFVETNHLRDKLLVFGLENVYVVNNFKNFIPTNNKFIKLNSSLNICFFSRILEKKGIEDIIDVVKVLNYKEVKVSLDIYGPIDLNYKKKFHELSLNFPDYIKYKGVVDQKDIIKILEKYDAQIFPTLFRTEGIPGSIIDSYFAGTPIISSKWDSFSDVIDEGKTGYGYIFGDKKDLERIIIECITGEKDLYSMREKCISKSYNYSKEYVISQICKLLNVD